MIPIRDTIPSRRVAWITRMLVALNVAAFVFELKEGPEVERLIYAFGVVPAHWLVSTFSDFLDWPLLFVSLISSQFLHGGILHLASNLLYLWIFGDNVEDRLGHGRFLLLYLASGIVAAVTQIVVTPRSAVPMIGASGAIAGILGAYLLMFPSARIITLMPLWLFAEVVEVPAFIFLGLWFVIQWFQGLTSLGQLTDAGGVAFWAHIGGFVSGMFGVAAFARRRW